MRRWISTGRDSRGDCSVAAGNGESWDSGRPVPVSMDAAGVTWVAGVVVVAGVVTAESSMAAATTRGSEWLKDGSLEVSGLLFRQQEIPICKRAGDSERGRPEPNQQASGRSDINGLIPLELPNCRHSPILSGRSG